MLADKGRYIASESRFYRVLRQANQLSHRGKAKARQTQCKPGACYANNPNQVWGWDITYLPGQIVGKYYRLYAVMDIYIRKWVGWEIHENETAIHVAKSTSKSSTFEITS